MESQSELESKLSLYAQQLSQVDELLQIDANNPQFLKLKEDLVSVISLTKALLIQVIGSSPSSQPIGNQSSESSATNGGNTSTIHAVPSAKPANNATKTGAIQVGEVVEVLGDQRVYAGVVTEVINDTEYKIKYFEYPTEVSLPVNSLQRLPSGAFTNETITQGLNCQCKYATDQNWYDCQVTALTEYGCIVTYTAYGNCEEVPLAYLRPSAATLTKNAHYNNSASSSSAQQSSGGGGGKNSKTGAGGLIPIPESLTILPTDTEKVSKCKLFAHAFPVRVNVLLHSAI